MRNKKLIGTGVAIVTPFNKNGKVDVNALTKIVKHLHEGQVDYIVVLGTTGESVTLSVEEKQLVISTVIKVNNNKLPLVLGIGGNNTSIETDTKLPPERAMAATVDLILGCAYGTRPDQRLDWDRGAIYERHTLESFVLQWGGKKAEERLFGRVRR